MSVTEAFKKSLLEYSKKINDCTNVFLNHGGARYGLTVIQLRLLMEIYREGPMTVGKIAEQLGQAGTNVSTMCKKLERSGLVSKVRRAEDERLVMVILTPEGESIMKTIDLEIDARITRMVEEEHGSDLIEMLRGLEHFCEFISKFSESELIAEERDNNEV
jgi:DNA-binding MarR family transcriptional regulator